MKRANKVRDVFESIAGIFKLLIIFILPIAFLVLFIKGAGFIAETILPFLYSLSSLLFSLSILIALPLSFIKKYRGNIAFVFLGSSFIFGITMWLIGFYVTYYLWGIAWVIIGTLFLGVGVVPLALLASLFNGEWGYLFTLLSWVVATFGFRFFAFWLIERSEQTALKKDVIDIDSSVKVVKKKPKKAEPSDEGDLVSWNSINHKEE